MNDSNTESSEIPMTTSKEGSLGFDTEKYCIQAVDEAVYESSKYLHDIMGSAIERAVRKIAQRIVESPSIVDSIVSIDALSAAVKNLSVALDADFDRCKINALAQSPEKIVSELEGLKKSIRDRIIQSFEAVGIRVVFDAYGARAHKICILNPVLMNDIIRFESGLRRTAQNDPF